MKAFCIIFMLFLAGPGYTQLTGQGTIYEPVRYVGSGLVDADWNETNTSYPFYTRSDDKGFIEACDELLPIN